jgi:hypothetical protein
MSIIELFLICVTVWITLAVGGLVLNIIGVLWDKYGA